MGCQRVWFVILRAVLLDMVLVFSNTVNHNVLTCGSICVAVRYVDRIERCCAVCKQKICGLHHLYCAVSYTIFAC